MNTTQVALALVAGVVGALLVHYVGDSSWASSIISGIVVAVVFLVVTAMRARRTS